MSSPSLSLSHCRGERERERGVSVPQAGWLLVGEEVRVWAGGREGQRRRLGQNPTLTWGLRSGMGLSRSWEGSGGPWQALGQSSIETLLWGQGTGVGEAEVRQRRTRDWGATDQPPPQAQADPEPPGNPRKHMEETPLPSGPLPGAELPGWWGGGEMRGAPKWLCGPWTRSQGRETRKPSLGATRGQGQGGGARDACSHCPAPADTPVETTTHMRAAG